MSWLNDLFSGDTKLLNKIKAQDFREQDSQIVSALMNPKKAGEILADWLSSQVSTAAGLPVQPTDEGDIYAREPDRLSKAMAALNIAGFAQGGSMPFAPPSAGGTLGTFIGPKAANWDKKAAATATKLLDNGVDPAQVWKEHLIGRMPDKSLFSEIDDSAAMAIPNKDWSWASRSDYKLGNNPLGPLKEFFTHKPLKSNYKGFFDYGPDDKQFTAIIRRGGGENASYHDGNITVGGVESLSPDVGGPIAKANKSTMLHELQHAIQEREGWAKGGSPSTIISESLSTPEAKYNAYRRLTGEAQARATQDRMNLNMQQRRDSYPLAKGLLSDIKLKDLINRYGNNGPSMSINKLPETQFSKAHSIAQKNAALPVEQGGLGLPANNTAMERAKALGHDTDAYHGSRNGDIKEFSNDTLGSRTGSPSATKGHFSTNNPNVANTYTKNVIDLPQDTLDDIANTWAKKRVIEKDPTLDEKTKNKLLGDLNNYVNNLGYAGGEVYPLMIRKGNNFTHDYGAKKRGDKSFYDFMIKAQKDGYDSATFKNVTDSLSYLKMEQVPSEINTIFDPKNIRSRFAAFDPMKKNSANILASMLLGSVALDKFKDK